MLPSYSCCRNILHITRCNTYVCPSYQAGFFLTASNIEFSDILETPSYFILPHWCVKPPKIVLDEVVLCRVRMGHTTYFTHSYILNMNYPPQCEHSVYSDSVPHFVGMQSSRSDKKLYIWFIYCTPLYSFLLLLNFITNSLHLPFSDTQ